MKKFVHIPVLLEKSAKLLITNTEGTYLDATLGLGGHSKYFLEILGEKGKIIAIDRDEKSIEIAKQNLKDQKNIIIKYANFANIKNILKESKIDLLDGVFFDLGLSSYHLDDAKRGFSFNKDGPLDMRFDTNSPLTAKEIINNWSYEKLRDIIKNYGEEDFANIIAEKIVQERKHRPIETTSHLKTLIEKAIKRRRKIHPATRSFQAIRIAVNSELESIKKALEDLSGFVSVGARMVVISYHSLEDRLVKQLFKKFAETKRWVVLTKKPIVPSRSEVEENPRSRSAKLRAVERIKSGDFEEGD